MGIDQSRPAGLAGLQASVDQNANFCWMPLPLDRGTQDLSKLLIAEIKTYSHAFNDFGELRDFHPGRLKKYEEIVDVHYFTPRGEPEGVPLSGGRLENCEEIVERIPTVRWRGLPRRRNTGTNRTIIRKSEWEIGSRLSASLYCNHLFRWGLESQF